MKSIKSIYYHNPKPENLERMIKWLLKKDYCFVSDEELYNILVYKKNTKKKIVFLSFDDAWRSNLGFIDVIEKYNVPITIFVPIEPLYSGNYWWDYVEQDKQLEYKNLDYEVFCKSISSLKREKSLERTCMNVEELIELSKHKLVSLQAHTITHPILTSLPLDILDYELRESKNKLQELINKPVRFFSYPNGTFSDRELEVTSRYFDMAFSIKMYHITLNDHIFKLPRIGLTGDFYKDILKYYGLWNFIRKVVYFFTRNKRFIKIAEYE